MSLIVGTALSVLLFSVPAQQGVHFTSHSIVARDPLVELPIGLISRATRATPRERHALWMQRSPSAALANPVVGARWDRSLGQPVLDAIAALPEERRAYGVSGLTLSETQVFCEQPAIELDVERDGEMFEARYRAPTFAWMTAPSASLYALSSTCTDALLTTGGAIAGAITGAMGNGCTLEDEAAHFPESSACRTCLMIDGDHARCVIDGACKPEMNRELAYGAAFYDVLEMQVLACAPNLNVLGALLVDELGEDNVVPDAFEHKIADYCTYIWNANVNEPRLYCTSEQGPIKLAIADVILGYVEHIRRAGETSTPYGGRVFMASSVEVEGFSYEGLPLFPGIFAEVSIEDKSAGGWGFNPRGVRPDGDGRGRDWIAAIALKSATMIEGVPIVIYDRNLCTDDRWRGPDAQGRSFCEPDFFNDTDPPELLGWQYDWGSFIADPTGTAIDTFPFVTIGATGFMDADIPGGHLPEILGTPVLADPDWENCAYPKQFTPDEKRTPDTFAGVHTFTSQTYRFGKTAEHELRLVLATNWRRAFCFEAIPGL